MRLRRSLSDQFGLARPLVFAGNTITYTQSVANAGPLNTLNAVFSESIPSRTTFQSISSLAGWTCVTPAVGGTGTITCTDPDFAAMARAPLPLPFWSSRQCLRDGNRRSR